MVRRQDQNEAPRLTASALRFLLSWRDLPAASVRRFTRAYLRLLAGSGAGTDPNHHERARAPRIHSGAKGDR